MDRFSLKKGAVCLLVVASGELRFTDQEMTYLGQR